MRAGHQQTDLLVLSFLRWDLVKQRPHHILKRFARNRRVFYFDEALFEERKSPNLRIVLTPEKVVVVTPLLPLHLLDKPDQRSEALKALLERTLASFHIQNYTLWYYDPWAQNYSRQLQPLKIIYDCMDELANFYGAPPNQSDLELELLSKADLVFTGGYSLYHAKAPHHNNVHVIPSSVDIDHFSKAKQKTEGPLDQRDIPHPRAGYFGVIDERFDSNLLGEVADLRCDVHFIVIGPVVRIDQSELPVRKNIHYLGKKDYLELPSYMSGWDCAIMPFALNRMTQFINPTKTPEYLAGGKGVVSTPIADVVEPYGVQGLVQIAHGPQDFGRKIDFAISNGKEECWQSKVEGFIRNLSWDKAFEMMATCEDQLWESFIKEGEWSKGGPFDRQVSKHEDADPFRDPSF